VGRVPLGSSPRHTGSVSSNPVVKAWHLTARFFTSLPPTPPSVDTELWVDDHLLAGERRLWIRLSNQDRRHSAAVAKRFVERRPTATRAEIAGAILHDVGKIACDLGTFGRVVATVVGPRTAAFRAYHDHEAIGAEMARAAGSEPETVDLIAQRGPAFAALDACDHA
jgi:putative nucleotidyltransferase with HDIG domain